jgi:hypothetical protein
MKCLSCDREFPEPSIEQENSADELKGGRFACPQCGAEHIRRQVGELPSGKPLYDIRLWGHLTAKRKPTPPGSKGTERRKSPRPKRWR